MSENFDLFISYASEDKEFVRPLAEALRSAGVSVWYDETELHFGDSLVERINAGLSGADFAIVVLSEHFLSKKWPQKELDALLTGERDRGVPRILPVWHGITAKQVRSSSPIIADRHAVSSDIGVERLARKPGQRAIFSNSYSITVIA
jgi:hypothetical protein